MTKERKIKALNAFIERAEKITYESREAMVSCQYDLEIFIRRVISDESDWLKRLEGIIWGPSPAENLMASDKYYAKFWESGKRHFIGILSSIKTEIELYEDEPSAPEIPSVSETRTMSNKVFIVHGHNGEMKLAAAQTITKLGLAPIILHEQPNMGRTIIEKFEHVSSDVGFAVVLLSGDDKAPVRYRARQNVILELGYFIAKLGRKNVVALYDTSFEPELPSDMSGVLYEPYDKPDGAWRYKVAQELKAAGFQVDANSLV
ncbi:MAG: nucleotide-binding protein [Oscillospiraceae bacterium]|jgi:predicted nucleotide-binding protein|nr:nucleotide-binding protein [Oscillospiraceae bacterium]